ncbi:hypothetical protein G6011_05617 [Alternaria panax]|uniref:F-box domain-containing protein n=1 Tax=Alternaria panax TaxID=48097 RepID=A0AAD4FDR3_9PLEO|nr:hypothetical protein G6011_05617 [Alternaria panax]
MTTHLLDLPTEILNQILTSLSTSSLLRFSETSHHARTFVNANLRTLSLGIAPLNPPFFNLLEHDQSINKTIGITSTKRPYAIWLRIPKAQVDEYWALLNFQSALVTSILKRHGAMLQNLEISVWALTLPMARAIANLRALRRFSLRIERAVNGPRSRIAVEREEQGRAWELLTKSTPVWSCGLMRLELENCDLETEQLAALLKDSWRCEELGLDLCRYLGKSLWTWLMEWKGRDKLRVLDVSHCGGTLGGEARTAMGKLDGIKSLNIYDCQEQEPGEFERYNRDLWHIANFVAPRPGGHGADMIIEVDTDY